MVEHPVESRTRTAELPPVMVRISSVSRDSVDGACG